MTTCTTSANTMLEEARHNLKQAQQQVKARRLVLENAIGRVQVHRDQLDDARMHALECELLLKMAEKRVAL